LTIHRDDDHLTEDPWVDDPPQPSHVEDAPPLDDADWDPTFALPGPDAYEVNLNGHKPAEDDKEHTSWWPVDLVELFDGTREPITPVHFTRTDGQPILYAGKAHAFNGAPESGKSWAALAATVEAINDGAKALYLDFEDTAETVVSRLLALGAEPKKVIDGLTYISPAEALWWSGKITTAGLEWADVLGARAFALAILDGVTEAMGIHGLDINSNNDVAAFYNMIPRRLQRDGTTTAQIDHIPKNREGGTRGGIGGQHKLAGIDVSFLFEVVAPFGVGQHGIARITIEKDRPGQLRQHAAGIKHDRIGEFHLISDPTTHELAARLEPITRPQSGADPGFEPTTLMQRVSVFVSECNANGQYPSQRLIEDGVSGKAEYIREAIAHLVRRGHLQKGGSGRKITDHAIITPYVAPDEDD